MSLIPEASAQALLYEQARTWLWIIEGGWGLLALVILCWTGFSARIRRFAEGLAPRWPPASTAVYGFLLCAFLVTWALPVSWLQVRLRKEFGLGDTAFATWIAGEAVQLWIRCTITAALLWLPFWLLRTAGPRAWLFFWIGNAAVMLVLKTFGAQVIAPLWEPVERIDDRHLEYRLQRLASSGGAGIVPVVVSVEQAPPGTIAADVRGIGPGVRIRLANTFRTWDADELTFVVAHELGHHVLGHLWQDTFLALTTLLASFLATQRAAEFLANRYGSRFGFSSLADPASAPLLLALLFIAMALAKPIENSLARHEEYEADIFALELTRNNDAAARVFLKAHTALVNPRPHPLIRYIRHDHPPLAERVNLANTYRPWETGNPLQFQRYFKAESQVAR